MLGLLKNTMTAIAACAAVVTLSSVSQARPELVMLKGVMVNGKLVSKTIAPAKTLSPAAHSYTYSFTVGVPLNKKVMLAGWALIDQSTCTESTAGVMHDTGPVRGRHGRWNVGNYQEPGYLCANGGTITAVFASVFYTWTDKDARRGTKDRRVTVWKARAPGFGRYTIKEKNIVVYSGS